MKNLLPFFGDDNQTMPNHAKGSQFEFELSLRCSFCPAQLEVRANPGALNTVSCLRLQPAMLGRELKQMVDVIM